MKRGASVAIFICLLVVLVGAGYFFLINKSPAEPPAPNTADAMQTAPGFTTVSNTTTPAAGPIAPPRFAPAGFKEYRNTDYRIALFYPENLRVQAFDEGSGASTIIFQDVTSAQGFQIFIVPYSTPQVSIERFKMDQPSGVMQEPHDLNIDGAFATMFVGKDQLLGPTREVWFIHGGYLFEVTAPHSLDEWLGTIMLTWRFI